MFLPNRHFDVRLTRAEFEDMIRAPIESTIGTLIRALRSAQVDPSQLSAVLLVGGSSRIPLVSRMISEELGRPTVVDAHPKYAVALGAATLARAGTAVGQRRPGLAGAQRPTSAGAGRHHRSCGAPVAGAAPAAGGVAAGPAERRPAGNRADRDPAAGRIRPPRPPPSRADAVPGRPVGPPDRRPPAAHGRPTRGPAGHGPGRLPPPAAGRTARHGGSSGRSRQGAR